MLGGRARKDRPSSKREQLFLYFPSSLVAVPGQNVYNLNIIDVKSKFWIILISLRAEEAEGPCVCKVLGNERFDATCLCPR